MGLFPSKLSPSLRMSSTSNYTIGQLLKWHPPKLQVLDGTKSTTPPSKFSQHLEDGLILKRIVHDPQMLDRLSKAADNKTSAIIGQIAPGLVAPFISATREMRAEGDVVECYDKELSPFYCALATHVLTGSPKALRREECAFIWTARDSKQAKGNIPDGVLRLNSAHPEVQPLKHIQALAAWEFKRIQVMDKELSAVMLKLIKEEIFHWCRCTIVNASSSNLRQDGKCTANRHFMKSGAYMYNSVPRGPDAFVPTGDVIREQDIGPPRLRALHINSLDDKAHHIFQQVSRPHSASYLY
ncbi:hypothetical protein BDN72DRAFT_503727 [Pluteus cervinus]|uniref:Uncharacterized protein n=1 Tax=Pluteus cervinus TaxID=181527 RepID=A0ACD3AYC1_9AGAR|nr:hypothetical protein BDN72DRAFT_503727 [Pluteus cervinus]